MNKKHTSFKDEFGFDEYESIEENDYRKVREDLKNQSDKYIPFIQSYLKKIFNEDFEVANRKQDYEESTDLISATRRIAVRTRSNEFKQYQDLAIRYKLRYSKITEFDKIIDSKCDYYVYCYLSKDKSKIEELNLIVTSSIVTAILLTDWKVFYKDDGSSLAAIPFHNLCIIDKVEYK